MLKILGASFEKAATELAKDEANKLDTSILENQQSEQKDEEIFDGPSTLNNDEREKERESEENASQNSDKEEPKQSKDTTETIAQEKQESETANTTEPAKLAIDDLD